MYFDVIAESRHDLFKVKQAAEIPHSYRSYLSLLSACRNERVQHAVTKGRMYSIQPGSNFKRIQRGIRVHHRADEKTNHLRRHYEIGLFDLSEEALLLNLSPKH